MAALYSPSSVGITQGNLQNGGWYNGRQYWNGQVGDAGVIINPNQQGSGQAVSSEVNRQSDTAQGLAPGTIDNYVAQQNQSTGGGGGGADAGGGSGGMGGADIAGAFGGNGQSSLNLPDLYNSLSNSAGIKNMEDSLTAKSQAYNDAMSKINDNPFLSESNRVGRGQKLTNDYNNDVKTTQDALTMAKQDVQTQLDLQTKQYDINSQAHTQALNEFNSLLSSGALAGATGNDIAAITKGTGISSSMIQAAIKSQTAKDTPTSVTTVDDGTNQYAVVMNTRTGAIISKQVLGASKPTSTGSAGGKMGSAEYNSSLLAQVTPAIISTLNSWGNISPQDWNKAKADWLAHGGTTADFVANFGGYADPNRGDFSQAYGFAKPKTAK